MGNIKSRQRNILVTYNGEMACERILFLLVKLYLEDKGLKCELR